MIFEYPDDFRKFHMGRSRDLEFSGTFNIPFLVFRIRVSNLLRWLIQIQVMCKPLSSVVGICCGNIFRI